MGWDALESPSWLVGDHPVMKMLPKWLLLHGALPPSTCKLSRAINYSSCPSRTPFSTRWSATSHPQTHFLLPPVLLWIILRLDVDQLSSSLVIWLHLQLWLQSNSASLSLSCPNQALSFWSFKMGRLLGENLGQRQAVARRQATMWTLSFGTQKSSSNKASQELSRSNKQT